MKLRYLIIFINLGLCAILLFCILQLGALKYHAVNLSSVNDRYKSIVDGLDKGVSIETLMEKYDCTILPLSAPDYYSVLYNSIDDGALALDYLNGDRLEAKIIIKNDNNSLQQIKGQLLFISILMVATAFTLHNSFFLYVYIKILRPFVRLKQFAANISIGNLDFPLYMQQKNYFGAFTESFDILREELKKARESEYQANKSKKELVAGLSHDIKTPVATINALCEILEIKLLHDENLDKIKTIHEKSNMIDQLISNMFHATLSDLQVLKVTPVEEPSTVLSDIFHDMGQLHPLVIKNELPECLIICDKLRLMQVIDNILSNSSKYAGTPIHISYQDCNDIMLIEIRDFGSSLKDEELPLLCGKFYRGSNASEKSGSGLGLYLAKQFMEGMEGSLLCEKDNGFVVTLSLKKVA